MRMQRAWRQLSGRALAALAPGYSSGEARESHASRGGAPVQNRGLAPTRSPVGDTFWVLRHGLALLMLTAGAFAAEPTQVDYLLDKDPDFSVAEPPLRFLKELKPLWLKALRHNEAEAQRQAAAAFARAHQLGLTGLEDVAPDLVAVLESATHPAARFAAGRTLVILNARNQADKLFRQLDGKNLDLAHVVEPALAEWDYAPARELWLERLDDPHVSRRLRVLAFRGLGRVKEAKAVPRLEAWVKNTAAPADFRIEAAEALATIQPTGLEAQARRLLADASRARVTDRLAGLRLLAQHTSPEAIELLQSVARDAEPAVATAALSRLFALSPDHTLPHVEWAADHADAGVRRIAIQTLAVRPTPDRIQLLALRLNDAHPENRGLTRERMLDLSKDFHDPVITGAMAMLATDRWRGLEQAALILGRLDHEPAAERLLELMDFPRPEVFIAAAWALRELAVEATLPRLLDSAIAETARREKGEFGIGRDDWAALVFESFGKLKYAAAHDVLLKYVPKSYTMGERSRTTAVWALGHIHAGKNPTALAAQLLERLMDMNPMFPEYLSVQSQSAVALGRMGSRQYVSQLRANQTPAAYWALEQLTGEAAPPQFVHPRYAGNWFLMPLNPVPDQ